MRQQLVIGNWKMNGSRASIEQLLTALVSGLQDTPSQVAVCPPAVYLQQTEALLAGSRVELGAQDVSPHASGAYTGEVALPMLQDFGCRYVLVGHSERRAYYGETDDVVAEKFAAVSATDMTPVLCVGETDEQRQQGQTEAVVLGQLQAVIDAVGIDALAKAVVAYEPVWAIGTGNTASPEQAQQVHGLIRDYIAQQNAELATQLPLLYGGSVNAGNAAELFAMPDIDGGLVGGASLKSEEFIAICQATTS